MATSRRTSPRSRNRKSCSRLAWATTRTQFTRVCAAKWGGSKLGPLPNFARVTIISAEEAQLQKIHAVIVRPLAAMLLAALFVAPLLAPFPLRADSRPVHAPHAVVASIDDLASKAGVEIMRQGGNA